MNLTVPNGIQKGDPITAAFLSDLCRAVKAITPQSSADILVSTTSGGTTFRQTNRPGGNSQSQSILFGTAAADYTSGTTISLTPCDCNGVATGEAAVTVTIPTSWGTVNLASATIGGTATAVTCKIASGELLQYAFAGATPYLLGSPPKQVLIDEKMTATGQQIQVAYLFGSNVSTVSAWMPVYALGIAVSGGVLKLQFTPTGGSATDLSTHTGLPSQDTPCDQPGS
jgi:hypothetical protein